MLTARRATVAAYHLGEGPLWHAATGRVVWLDVEAGVVWAAVVAGSGMGQPTEVARVPGSVGAVAAAGDGRLVLAVENRVLDDAGRVLSADAFEADGDRRFNDGCVDPRGRLVVGTMRRGGDSTGEQLLRLESDGTWTVLRDGLTLSNGVGFCHGGRTIVHVDTLRRTIATAPYVEGRLAWATAFEVDDGYPDGLAVDTRDRLWVAIWGRGEVRCYALDGTVVEQITVPAPHTSSVAFVGHRLDRLVITTAWQDLTEEQRRNAPASGALFLSSPGCRGAHTGAWATDR